MDWGKIQEDYEQNGLKPAELEKKYGVKAGTIRSTASRKNWQKPNKKCNATKNKNAATKKQNVATLSSHEIVIENNELTDKEILFCVEYLAHYNGTQSYLNVYDCTYNTARTESSRLLAKPYIKKELARLKQMQRNGLYLNAQDIVQKQIEIAFASITNYVSFGSKQIKIGDKEESVNYVNLRDSNQVDGSLITEIKEGREGVSIKLMDKRHAFDFLFKFFNTLTPDEQKRLQDEKQRDLKNQALELDIERKREELKVMKDEGNANHQVRIVKDFGEVE